MTQVKQATVHGFNPHESVAHTKRFLEYWTADVEFRKIYDEFPEKAMTQYGLKADHSRLQALIDRNAVGIQTEEVMEYRAFIRSKLEFRHRYRVEGAPSNEKFRLWRERQMRRAFWELSPTRADAVVHAPICFELSAGCTVGCWFCGVAAESFAGNFEYTPENVTLWREVLGITHEIVGDGAGCGFCYWATDPLDNPDYESLITDFHDILGRLPQTTTAIPLRDVERTRSLLQLSARLSEGIERFSVLSRGQFKRIMESFTAEELVMVELIPQFNHNVSPKVLAGSARNRLKAGKKVVPMTTPKSTEDGGTIACVSGFLVNMVERKVQLISPCTANQRWPLGYIVFYEFKFNTAAEFRDGMESAIANAMRMNVDNDDAVRLHPKLKMTRHENGVTLSSSAINLDMASQIESSVLSELIAKGETLSEIANQRAERCGVPHAWTHQEVDHLWNQGLLEEVIR